MPKYIQQKNVLVQKDVRLVRAGGTACALQMYDDAAVGNHEIVAILQHSGVRFSLNLTGAFIWECLDAPRSSEELLECLESTYSDIEREQLTNSLLAFLDELAKLNLVEIIP